MTYEEAIKEQNKWKQNKIEEIERYKKKITKAELLINVSINCCDDLTEKEKRRAKSLINSFSPEKINRNNRILSSFEKILEKQNEKNHSLNHDIYTIEKMIKEKIETYKNPPKIDSEEISKIALNIWRIPKSATLKYAREIKLYYSLIKQTEKELDTPPKLEYEENIPLRTEIQDENKEKQNNTNVAIEKTTKKIEIGRTPHLLKQEKKDIYEKYDAIDDWSKQKIIDDFMRYQRSINLIKKYKTNYSNPFKKISTSQIELIISNLNVLSNIIITTLPKELTTYRNPISPQAQFYEQIMTDFNITNCLEEYKNAYTIYQNLLAKLTEEQKQNISATQIDYTPEKLKTTINDRITKIAVENKIYDITSIGYQPINASYLINRMTTFMNTEEIEMFYIKAQKKLSYIEKYDKTQIELANSKKRKKVLQENFAKLLINRLPKEKKQNKTRDELLYYVCTEMLKEEPLFEINLDKKQKNNLEEIKDTETKEINSAITAAHNARNRFFGMKKTEQTLQRINGEWKKFEKTWKKAQEAKDQTEINKLTEELNCMFKR